MVNLPIALPFVFRRCLALFPRTIDAHPTWRYTSTTLAALVALHVRGSQPARIVPRSEYHVLHAFTTFLADFIRPLQAPVQPRVRPSPIRRYIALITAPILQAKSHQAQPVPLSLRGLSFFSPFCLVFAFVSCIYVLLRASPLGW